jgi:hypothetical protein
MCTVATQIIETEMRIEQAQNNHVPQEEIDILRRELKELEEKFEEFGNESK